MRNYLQQPLRLSDDIVLSDGFFGIGEYICCFTNAQELLLSAFDEIVNYTEHNQSSRPLNFYIEATPGSGKSFLVNQICKACNETLSSKTFSPIIFNVATATNPQDLTAIYKIIQTKNIEDTMPIVFFDEVDSKVNGQYIFSNLLMPMYDGKFIDGATIHALGRAIFFFAGSKPLTELLGTSENLSKTDTKNEEEIEVDIADKINSNKMSFTAWIKDKRLRLDQCKELYENIPETSKILKLNDFIDRIDKVIYIPPSYVQPDDTDIPGLSNSTPVEEIIKRKTMLTYYQTLLIVGAMILKHHPNVERVNSELMEFFVENLLVSKSKRGLESMILRAVNPANGILGPDHMPVEYNHTLEQLLDQNPHADQTTTTGTQNKYFKLSKKR